MFSAEMFCELEEGGEKAVQSLVFIVPGKIRERGIGRRVRKIFGKILEFLRPSRHSVVLTAVFFRQQDFGAGRPFLFSRFFGCLRASEQSTAAG